MSSPAWADLTTGARRKAMCKVHVWQRMTNYSLSKSHR